VCAYVALRGTVFAARPPAVAQLIKQPNSATKPPAIASGSTHDLRSCSNRIVVASRSSNFENPSVRVRAAVMSAMMIIALIMVMAHTRRPMWLRGYLCKRVGECASAGEVRSAWVLSWCCPHPPHTPVVCCKHAVWLGRARAIFCGAGLTCRHIPPS